jgi:hypothetical protein
MALGPGKYDDQATQVRTATQASGAIVIILGGVNGSGFSVQGPIDLEAKLPAILRNVANQIESDLKLHGNAPA